MNIEFNGVRLLAKKNRVSILKTIDSVIKKGVFLNGYENKKFIDKLKKYLGGGYITLTGGGHYALVAAVRSLGLSRTDELILPANAYPTAFAVARAHVGKLRLVGVDENGLIDVEKLKSTITKKTKALIVVHLYGFIVPMEELLAICKKRSIILIEDCAQAFGSYSNGQPAGSFGDISCFSFYPTKNYGTLGDGGAVWTKNKEYHRYFQKVVAYGETRRYKSKFVADHSRLPEIQAAILNSLYKNVWTEKKDKQLVFKKYMQLFKNSRLLNDVVRVLNPEAKDDIDRHLFVIEVGKRNQLRKYLKRRGITTSVHYPEPIHLISAFGYLGYRKGAFPQVEKLASRIVSLPFHAYLKDKEMSYVVESIKSFYHV